MAPNECSILFFDSETGGLSPFDSDFVELACVLTDPSGEVIREQYAVRVFPEKPVNPKAAAINGYSEEKWAGTAVPLREALTKVVSMSQGALLAGHNVFFDWNFLEHALKRNLMKWNGDYHRIDTMSMAIPLWRKGIVPNVKLQTLAAYFGINPGDAHRALSDTLTCRALYLHLTKLWDKTLADVEREVAGGDAPSEPPK